MVCFLGSADVTTWSRGERRKMEAELWKRETETASETEGEKDCEGREGRKVSLKPGP